MNYKSKPLPSQIRGRLSLSKRYRLVAVICLLMLAGFIATSILSYEVSKRSIRSSITDTELPLTSEKVFSDIEKSIVSPVIISSTMAHDTFLRDWVIGGEKNTDQITRYLTEIMKKYGAFTSFFVSEKTRYYYHARGILRKIKEDDPRDKWYFRMRNLKSAYEVNVDQDILNEDKPTIFINYPVFHYSGNIIGAAGVGLSFDAIMQGINEYDKQYHRNVFIADSDGNIVISGSNDERRGLNIRKIEGLSELADDILSKHKASFVYKTGRDETYLYIRPLPELNWYLFVEKKDGQAFSGIKNTLYTNLLISFAVCIVVMLIVGLSIRDYQDKIESLAVMDELTALPNRRALRMIMAHMIHEANRRGAPLSLMVIDIDHLKQINDGMGHLIGDEVIKGVAQIIRGRLRKADLLCRWGGDEYLAVIHDANLKNAELLAQEIRQTVENASFGNDNATIKTTLSIGVSQYKQPETDEQFISRTDKALYEAKQSGRNRVYVI